MRHLWFTISALAIGSVSTAGGTEGGSDEERLAGRWVMASLMINGENAPEEQVVSARLRVEGNRYTPQFEGKDISETFKIDADTKPRSIDFTYTDGPRKGETVKGIYKLEGDRYTMCRPLLAEAPRPTEFSSAPESGLVVVVWARDTPAEQARRKAIEDDRKAFEGTWVGESNIRDGITVSDDEVKQVRLILTGERYTLERGGDRTSRGTCKIDPMKTPKTMDISIIDGVNKGQTWLGIYELSGDLYHTCFATAGNPRPSRFRSEPGSGNILWVFRREKN